MADGELEAAPPLWVLLIFLAGGVAGRGDRLSTRGDLEEGVVPAGLFVVRKYQRNCGKVLG